MNIGRQWEDRLRIWGEQFEKHYARKAAELEVSTFTTMEHLPFETAVQGPYSPAANGMKWGAKWEYGWFHTSFCVPEALAGERLILCLNVGEEMLVWVNGEETGSIDKKHRHLTLTRCARAGERFEIYAECYAGHGVRAEGGGPVGPNEETVPEPPCCQQTIRPSIVAVWNETVFQAAMDYLTLYHLVQKLPPKSLRAMKIIQGLKQFTCIADFELPEDELTQSVAQAAKVLKPMLECRNGSTAPEYTVFGQSHLDMAWLWPVEETMRKTARTYSNQLALMEEYPEYRFLMCEPPILEYLQSLYPKLYRRVQSKLASGAFIPEGAMWIESDTNIPSGESLIRQFVRGRRWFREHANAESRLAWMPDTFGFSAALPQIMTKCGVSYFATQKLVRQDPEADPFPYNLFWWEGLDGSRVLAHLYKKNNANFNSGDLLTRWEDDRIQQEGIDGLIYPFGFGDGGGGPTREMLETYRRCRDLEGAPRCRMESPVRYFERAGDVENVYCGELYLAWHRGTLTAQARTKRGIRKAEIALKQAEYHLSRQMLQGREISPRWHELLEESWKLLLFNQFHDIAPGTSIARVHERAERELAQVESNARQLLGEMLDQPSAPTAVYNHLSRARRWQGRLIAPQSSEVLAECPGGDATVQAVEQGFLVCNSRLRCLISPLGEVTSVRIGEREFLAAPGNRLLMYRDVNGYYDAWEISSMYEENPVALDQQASVEPFRDSDGAGVRIRRRLHHSVMEQTIRLEDGSARLDFHTEIDWHERHKLLKVSFPVNARASEAVHEIQFGQIRRPAHRSRQHDRDQYEVCNHRYTALCDPSGGAAVLNDCKYGVSTHGRDICLTLLRAPLMPDMTADQGVQQFSYAFYPFEGCLEQSDVVHEARAFNEPPVTAPFCGDTAPVCLPDRPNLIVDTIKPADTVENALLVRVYECMGMQTEAAFTLHPAVRGMQETDMLEESARAADPARIHFDAFEIKTFLLTL